MSSVQFIKPKTSLKDKVGRVSPIDPEALARAEAALKSLSGQFQAWMEEEVVKLDAAREAASAAGMTEKSLADVYGASHDAKGMGGTYEYPLVTALAASLCRFLETPETREIAAANFKLVDAHVDAIKAAVRGQIKTTDHPVGRTLLLELDTQVAALLPPKA